MDITSDLDVFFKDFAADITAYDDDSVEHTLSVLFDNESVVKGQIITSQPRIVVRTSDAEGLSNKWVFEINGNSYDVMEIFPDNQGTREIYLTEHVDE